MLLAPSISTRTYTLFPYTTLFRSSRPHDIEQAKERVIAEYTARHHGRAPHKKTIVKLRAQATLETRPAKSVHSLAELIDQWRTRATNVLGDRKSTRLNSSH